MYLPACNMRKMLQKCGVNDSMYDELYISGEIGLTKRTGNLFKFIARELAIPRDKILHIGDHRNNDYDMALKMGLNAMLLDNTPYKSHFKSIDMLSLRIIRGISNNLITNYRCINVKPCIGGYEIGASLIGPIVYIYILASPNNSRT